MPKVNEFLANTFLKNKKVKLQPKNIYGFDIETYGENNTFLMGSIVNEKEKYVFWDKKEMQDFILKSHKIRNSRLFATNLGFDFLALFGTNCELKNEKDFKILSKFEFLIKNGEFINIKLRQNEKNLVEFSDTMNFLRAGVYVLGKIIGIDKLYKPHFLGAKVLRYTKEGQELEQYNINDSYITFRFADFLQKTFNDLGANMKYTIASTSMELFRSKYLKTWIQQPIKPLLKLMFDGYYGGRVEAFCRGDLSLDNDKKYLYDINSLYPYVMESKLFPLPSSLDLHEGHDLKYIKNYEGLSYCYIESEFDMTKLVYPLLPYRDMESKKLLFPIGIFYGWHTHAELRKAIEIGYKIEVIKTIYYKETFNPFYEFVEDLYRKRMEYKKEKSILELPMKILLNSLYGKFAQKPIESEILFTNIKEDYDKVENAFAVNDDLERRGFDKRYYIDTPDHNERKEGDLLITEPRFYYLKDLDTDNYAKFINPIISIYITSYARLELYKYIENCIKTNHKVYYCDTDSIMTNKKLPVSSKLGDLKLECKIKNGIIVKPKFYYIENNDTGKNLIKAKGMSNLKELIDFKKVLETKEYTYMKFTKFKESFRRKLPFNTKIDVTKIINFEDDKRKWSKEFDMYELQYSFPRIIIEREV